MNGASTSSDSRTGLHGGRISSTRQRVVVVLLFVAAGASLVRTVRMPNDFAEAHWLLDYRFGFFRRGLPAQVLTWCSELTKQPVTPGLIAAIAFVLLAAMLAALLWCALRIVRLGGWRTASVAAMVAFLTSSFGVLAGHLVGYYDHIVVLLCLASVWLTLRGRAWVGAVLQAAALLVHEGCLLLTVPVFAMACLLRPDGGHPVRRLLPLLLPAATMVPLTLVVAQPPPDFVTLCIERLRAAGFVAPPFDATTPVMLTIPLRDILPIMVHGIAAEYRTYLFLFALMSPAVIALVVAQRWPVARTRRYLVCVVVLAPQAMHLLAWDRERIVSYSLFTAFVAAWILAEVHQEPPPSSRLAFGVGVVAVAVNLLVATPLMDLVEDRLSLEVRAMVLVALLLGLFAVARSRPAAASASA